MKALLALLLIAVFAVVGFVGTDPIFDAAAAAACRAYAEEERLTLVEADGKLARRSSRFTCRFTGGTARTRILDQDDDVIPETARYRFLYVLGWVANIVIIAAGAVLAGIMGLMESD